MLGSCPYAPSAIGRKNWTLSVLPASARIITRLNRRLALSSGDICEMSGGRVPPLVATGAAGSSVRVGALERMATTVTNAPRAAPASAHGRPARQPVAFAVATGAPHLWQKRAVEESGAPHA